MTGFYLIKNLKLGALVLFVMVRTKEEKDLKPKQKPKRREFSFLQIMKIM